MVLRGEGGNQRHGIKGRRGESKTWYKGEKGGIKDMTCKGEKGGIKDMV